MVGGKKVLISNKITVSSSSSNSLNFSNFLMGPSRSYIRTPGEKRRYQCPACDKSFSRSDHLKRHSLTHLPPDKRPFKCSICNKSFLQVADLKMHSYTHTPDPNKAHGCPTCGKCFGTKTHLNQHMAYHRSTDERPFKCSEPDCTKAFAVAADLKRHSATHNTVNSNSVSRNSSPSSSNASKSPSASGSILMEMFTKYQCTECNLSFTTQHLLDAHKNIHDPLSDSNKTYPCTLCDKVFGKAQNLR